MPSEPVVHRSGQLPDHQEHSCRRLDFPISYVLYSMHGIRGQPPRCRSRRTVHEPGRDHSGRLPRRLPARRPSIQPGFPGRPDDGGGAHDRWTRSGARARAVAGGVAAAGGAGGTGRRRAVLGCRIPGIRLPVLLCLPAPLDRAGLDRGGSHLRPARHLPALKPSARLALAACRPDRRRPGGRRPATGAVRLVRGVSTRAARAGDRGRFGEGRSPKASPARPAVRPSP